MLAARVGAAQQAAEPACSSRIPGLQLEAALRVAGASQAVAAGADCLSKGGASPQHTTGTPGGRSAATATPLALCSKRLHMSAICMQSSLRASPGTCAQDFPGRMTALLLPPWLFLHERGSWRFTVKHVKFYGHDRDRNSSGMEAAYSQEAANAWPSYGLVQSGVCSSRLLSS